jgi:hypothetical protein
MGVATFKMEGGVSSSVGGGWRPEKKIALQTVFSVAASADEAMPPVDLRSQNENILVSVFTDDEPTGGETGFFQAIGEGRASVEFFSVDDNELLDFFMVDVRAAEQAHLFSKALLLGEESSAPDYLPIGIVQSIPVILDIGLIDSTGDPLNHHHVVTAVSGDSGAVEAVAGGTIVVLEGIEGSTTVTIGAIEQTASTVITVHTLEEAEVTQLTIREIDDDMCQQSVIHLFADLATDQGIPVLGYPVSWSVEGGELSSEADDSVTVEFEPNEPGPIRVTAVAGILQAEFLADRNRVCPDSSGGCSVVGGQQARPKSGLILAIFFLLTLSGNRRHRTIEGTRERPR